MALNKRIFFSLVLVFSVIGAAKVSAAELYKYKDANGNWVFTDQVPETSKDYKKQKMLFTQREQKVSVINRGTDEKPILYAINQVFGPVQVWLEFSQTKNLKLDDANNLDWVLTGPKEELILELQPEDPGKDWSYGWSYRFAPGKPVSEKSISKSPLGVPVKGGPFVISQAFSGESSHNQHIESRNSIDIAVPLNTPIIAVRSGLVMSTEKDFSRSGWSEEYADEANMVRVLHSDGSMALYAHLKVDGIEVVPGQRVRKGQVLAYSGNTGYSSGPHLHFSLQINKGRKLVSVPFVIEGYSRFPKVGDVVGH